MSQINDGVISVTNGSSTVTGSDTEFLQAAVGNLLIVVGDIVSYEIASIQSDTELSLTAPYGGETVESADYVIHQTFTPSFEFPYPERGDIETATIVKRAIKEIDDESTVFVTGPAGTEVGSAPSEVPTNEIWEQEYLAQNGGTVPEVDRENVFSETQIFDSVQSIAYGRQGGQNVFADHDAAFDLEDSRFSFRIGRNTTGADNVVVDLPRGIGQSSTWISLSSANGSTMGSPSGGAQGDGTLNAEELYEDGNRVVTDYVFDAELDGDIDAAHYDALMGEREIDEGEDEGGKPKVRREKQTHRPAHAFRENTSELEPTEFAKRWRKSRKLPAMERCESSLRDGQERPSLGQTLQAVLETCEVQAVHIDRLEKRIKELEKKIDKV